MICCDVDGYYCKECNMMHPSIMWHKKYNDYLLNRKEEFEKSKAKRPLLYGDAEFVDNLPILGLEQMEEAGKCIICGESTFFKDLKTHNYVCSIKCKSNQNNMTILDIFKRENEFISVRPGELVKFLSLDCGYKKGIRPHHLTKEVLGIISNKIGLKVEQVCFDNNKMEIILKVID